MSAGGPPDPSGPARNNLVRSFTNEDQDPKVVDRVCSKVKDILTRDEKILYVAVQKKPIATIAPDSVVLTNRRFICFRPKILGRVTFDDYHWRDLSDAQLREDLLGATLSMRTVQGHRVAVSYLPKAQARRLYAYAQEMEEKVREERRTRALEEKRAAAGGVILGGTEAAGHLLKTEEPDPVQRLKKLKEMLDAGLMTQSEFDGKRAEIIAKM